MHHIFKREWLVAAQHARPHTSFAENEIGSSDVSALGEQRSLAIKAVEREVDPVIT